MSGHIGVLGRVYICILLVFGVLLQDGSELMMFRGKVRGMVQEDNEGNPNSTPNGGNGNRVSGKMVDKGKSKCTEPKIRRGRRRRSLNPEYVDKTHEIHSSFNNPTDSGWIYTFGSWNESSNYNEELFTFGSWNESSNYNEELFDQLCFPMNAIGSNPGLHYQHSLPMVSFPLSSCSLPMPSSSSSSLMGLMELPSNQISSRSFPSINLWQDQRAGENRSYPFSVDSVTQMHRDGFGVSSWQVNNETVLYERLLLEPPPSSSLPATTSGSRLKTFRHPNPAAQILPYHLGAFDFSALPFQPEEMRAMTAQISEEGANRRRREQSEPHCHAFFPLAPEHNGQGEEEEEEEEEEEGLDLELRLRTGELDLELMLRTGRPSR